MTDRELLELSAKAAGMDVMRSRLQDPMHRDLLVRQSVRNTHHENGPWNPLTDDGDALRLAVVLKITSWIDSFDACCSWCPSGQNPFSEGMDQVAEMIQNNDPYAAMRRAITRAAAEIGKSMQ